MTDAQREAMTRMFREAKAAERQEGLFPLGRLTATPAALAALRDTGGDIGGLLWQHSHGDWGVLGGEDWDANDVAVKTGGRILSSYSLKDGEKVWVITEADRSSTCVLLPDDY